MNQVLIFQKMNRFWEVEQAPKQSKVKRLGEITAPSLFVLTEALAQELVATGNQCIDNRLQVCVRTIPVSRVSLNHFVQSGTLFHSSSVIRDSRL